MRAIVATFVRPMCASAHERKIRDSTEGPRTAELCTFLAATQGSLIIGDHNTERMRTLSAGKAKLGSRVFPCKLSRR